MNSRLNHLVLQDRGHHRGSNNHGYNTGPSYNHHGYNGPHIPAVLHNMAGQGGRALYGNQHHIMVPSQRIGGQPLAWKNAGPGAGAQAAQIIYDRGNVSID